MTSQRISAYVLKDLVQKLNPGRFPGIPPSLAALTGFVLGAVFSTPHIVALVITDSGIVLARANVDAEAKRVLGSHADVLHNWIWLVSRAGLTPDELMAAQSLFAEKVGFLGATNA